VEVQQPRVDFADPGSHLFDLEQPGAVREPTLLERVDEFVYANDADVPGLSDLICLPNG
jgi:hypothetical protein